jgi:hypothetical protein
VFRNGFHDALRLKGVDADRFVTVSPMLRDSLRTAPDTLFPTIEAERISLWPDVNIELPRNGTGLLTTGSDTFHFAEDDEVVFWNRHRMIKL